VAKPLKKQNEIALNSLCLSCRRTCKQAAVAVVAECKRYYAGPRVSRKEWKQLNLPLT
jgi:hypothetical protein